MAGKIREFGSVFLQCFLWSFAGLSAAYFILRAVFGQSPVGPPFYIFMKIIAYWDDHPLQYLAVVCGCYTLLSAAWAAWLDRSSVWWWRSLQIVGVLLASVYLSSFACGALWALHDMQAGYFPDWAWRKVWYGARDGLNLGPKMVGNSPSLTFVAFVLGYAIIDQITSKKSPRRNETPAPIS